MPVCPKCGSSKVEQLSATELKSRNPQSAQLTVVQVYQCECGTGFTAMVTTPKPLSSDDRSSR
jgi:hypothetical protein